MIDPKTQRIVWQYGHFGIASSAPGYLSKPDGLDLLPAVTGRRGRKGPRHKGRRHPRPNRRHPCAEGTPPLRAGRGAPPYRYRPRLRGRAAKRRNRSARRSHRQRLIRPGTRRETISAAPHRHPASSDPRRRRSNPRPRGLPVWGRTNDLVRRHRPPRPDNRHRQTRRHDRRAALRPRRRHHGPAVFLVGGYTGTAWATAIQRFVPAHTPTVVGRLPTGLRYAGVATLRNHIYIAGGATTAGTSSAILSFDPPAAVVRQIGSLPHPVAHAALVALGQSLYLIGGTDAGGNPVKTVIRIDPHTGNAAPPRPRCPTRSPTPAAVATDRTIVVIGGKSTDTTTDMLEIRPA